MPALNHARILSQLDKSVFKVAENLHIFDRLESTNAQIKQFEDDGVAVLAESQTAGRGRIGREWIATPRQNLLLSVSKVLRCSRQHLGGLSLAAGVAAVNGLARLGIGGIGLKWPNDLLVDRLKIGGILVEVLPHGDETVKIIIGLGLNVCLSEVHLAALSGKAVDLAKHTGSSVDRSDLAAAIINELFAMLVTFELHSFAVFRQRWESLHVFQRCPVTLHLPHGRRRGVAEGVDDGGRLRLRDGLTNELSFWDIGEVSLRG